VTRRPMPAERASLTHKFSLPGDAPASHLAKLVRGLLASDEGNELPEATRYKLQFAVDEEFPEQQQRVKGYVTVGLYEDGTVGEIFVKMDKQGSQISGFVDCWAIAVSMLLQSGTSLESIVAKFRNVSFEPAGVTGNREIPFARSPVDYIASFLEKRFLNGDKRATKAEG
jgi:hypothetical protein